jgi:hypothetical protein
MTHAYDNKTGRGAAGSRPDPIVLVEGPARGAAPFR